jgi:hypothetical protein
MGDTASQRSSIGSGSGDSPVVFLAFPFRPRDAWIKHSVPRLLTSWGYEVEMGAHFHGRPIGQSVAAAIGRAQLLVCFLMRCEKLAGTGWSTSDWVLQELGFARGRGIPVVVVRERSVRANVGMLGDVQVIELDPTAPFLALLPLQATLRGLLPTPTPTAEIQVRHLAKPGAQQGKKQWWDFWTWIEGPASLLDSITGVSYVFPRSFRPAVETSSNRQAAFGNYGETDKDFDLRIKINFNAKPSKKLSYKVTLFRPGYD